MWTTLTADDVRTRLAAAELAALQTAALASGQTDPLPEIVAAVTDEVRGYIAANHANELGVAGAVPPRLVSAALAIIRYRLATRLPVKSLLTEDRVKENEAAIRLLERVAAGQFAIEDADGNEQSGVHIEQASTPTRTASRSTLAGL